MAITSRFAGLAETRVDTVYLELVRYVDPILSVVSRAILATKRFALRRRRPTSAWPTVSFLIHPTIFYNDHPECGRILMFQTFPTPYLSF